MVCVSTSTTPPFKFASQLAAWASRALAISSALTVSFWRAVAILCVVPRSGMSSLLGMYPASIPGSYGAAPVHVQRLVEQQVQEEMRKSAKRAANRRSATTCRARKRQLMENMAEANERMRKRCRVLALHPDMILAFGRDGVVTYASENCVRYLDAGRKVKDDTESNGESMASPIDSLQGDPWPGWRSL